MFRFEENIWQFHIMQDICRGDNLNTCLLQRKLSGSNHREALGSDGLWHVVPLGEPFKDLPLFTTEQLQGIVQGLWDYGFRPNVEQERRYENELELKTKHLEDMRRLVFKKEYSPL